MRRVFLIPKDMRVEDALRAAELNNCPEICRGIPPRLLREGKIKEEDLPMVYEEPIIEPEPTRDLFKEIDEIKTRLDRLGH